MPLLISDAFPSRFLKVDNFAPGERRRLRISSVQNEVVGSDGKEKMTLTFNDGSNAVLNRTNANILAAQYGNDALTWVDRPVVLSIGNSEFNGARMIRMEPVRTSEMNDETPW